MNSPPDSHLSDYAIDWVIKLHSGCISDAEKAELSMWRSLSPGNEQAFQNAMGLWLEMGTALELDLPETAEEANPVYRHLRRLSRRMIPLLLVLVWLVGFKPYRLWFCDYHTSVGQHSEVRLSDGSTVVMNTDTAMNIEFKDQKRHIRLLRGQAVFSVAADPARPFVVTAGTVSTTALGTVFDVYRRDQATQVSVLEHAVQVEDNAHGLRQRKEQGQLLTIDKDGKAEPPQTRNFRDAMAWQQGKLIFRNQSLAEALSEIERYYHGRIFIASPELRQIKLTGVFPLDNPETTLRDIASVLSLNVIGNRWGAVFYR